MSESPRSDRTLALQVNVQKSYSGQLAVLQLALQLGIHIICIQEPYHRLDRVDPSKNKTVTIPAFKPFLPQLSILAGMHVLTFVNKDIAAEQILPAPQDGGQPGHSDLVVVKVKLSDASDLTIYNLYNPCLGVEKRWQAVKIAFPMVIAADSRALICGDFNTDCHLWNEARDESRDVEELVSWYDRSGVTLTSPPDVITHNRGGVLDLTFATPALLARGELRTEVRPDLASGGDHETLLTTISRARPQPLPARKRFNLQKMDREAFHDALRDEFDRRAVNESLEHESLDDDVAWLQRVVLSAMETSTPETSGKGTGKRWWNDECTTSVVAKRRAWTLFSQDRDSQELYDQFSEARRQFKRTIRKAMRVHWGTYISNLTDPRDIFRAAKWSESTIQTNMPPLTDELTQATAESSADKASMLMDRHTQPADPPDQAEDVAEPNPDARPLDPVTENEAARAIFRPGSSAPGQDGLSAEVWKRSWHILGEFITHLFDRCLRAGYHPKAFRSAQLVPIHKQGRDKRSPKGYRLISLLSTLGKALERIVATRLAWQAVELQIVSRSHAGSIPKRGTTDLVMMLADQILNGFKRKHATSFLTFDVKGAFDNVKKRLLLRRLREQRWPEEMCRWVDSFLSERSVSMSVDGGTAVSRNVGGSLPQGSPVSPILFALFTAPLFAQVSYGYADDGCIAYSSDSIAANSRAISSVMTGVRRWCIANELELDWAKSNLMHCRRRNIGGREVGVKLNFDPLDPTSVPFTLEPPESVTWLGVKFDKLMNGRSHVEERTTRARRAVNGIKCLSGVFKGAPPSSLLLILRSVVLPRMMYGLACFPKLLEASLRKMELVLRAGIRAGAPAYRTTPIHLLHTLTGFPTVEILHKDLVYAAAIRSQLQVGYHPLSVPTPDGLIDTIQRSLPGRITPWMNLHAVEVGPSGPLPPKVPKAQAVIEHAAARAAAPATSIWVYTDGSRDDAGRTGAGWVIYVGRTRTASGQGSCGTKHEVVDAEAIAAFHGTRLAIESAPAAATHLYVCLDNYSVVQRLAGTTLELGSSQGMIDQTRSLLHEWVVDGRQSHVHWVPGHCDVEGNEQADALAKAGCTSAIALVSDRAMSACYAKRWTKEQLRDNFKAYQESQPARRHLGRRFEVVKPWDGKWMGLEHRASVGRVFTAASGHGDTLDYHFRFDHDDAEIYCPFCGAEKTPAHPWTCNSNERRFSERFVNQLLLGNKSRGYLLTQLHPKWRAFKPLAPGGGDIPV